MHFIPLAGARRRFICSLRVSTITHPGVWVDHASEGGETGDRRDPSPDSESAPPVRAPDPLSLLDPDSSKTITLSHQFRSRLRPRLLSRILPDVNSNADLWNVRHSPALPLRPPPQDHSVHVFTLKLSPTPRRLQSPQEVRRTSVETSESCG